MKHGTHVVRFMVWTNDNFGAFKSKKNLKENFFVLFLHKILQRRSFNVKTEIMRSNFSLSLYFNILSHFIPFSRLTSHHSFHILLYFHPSLANQILSLSFAAQTKLFTELES